MPETTTDRCRICRAEVPIMLGEQLGVFFICDLCMEVLFELVREARERLA